jgi:hypothetical protein
MAIEIVSFLIKHGGSFHSFLYVYQGGYNWVGIWVLCRTRIDIPEYGTLLRHCLRIREYVPDLLGFMSTDCGCIMGFYGIYKQQHDLLGTYTYIYIHIYL